MVLKSYLIAPFDSGLVNNVEPWLLPEAAFQIMTNAYTWRGRVRKRFGYAFIGTSALLSRLRINIGTTTPAGPGEGSFDLDPVPGTIFAIGQQFSIGDEIFTVVSVSGAMLATGNIPSSTHTFNTTTGAVSFTLADINTSVYFYPSTPVMGLRTREAAATNSENLVAFDQQFSYKRMTPTGGWELLGPVPTAAGYAQWSSSDSEFFWTTNYRSTFAHESALWVVNNKDFVEGIPPIPDTDGIKFIDETSSTWQNIRPKLNTSGTRRLESGAIIVGFKNRLVVLNTRESLGGNTERHRNRARFSINGDPTEPDISWLDEPGQGGFTDAPTQEAIITIEFIKGHMIVYFERSTWELFSTGDIQTPFDWQQLNSELGAESRFSIVGFDQGAVGVGNVGIHTCNGVNVKRIDDQIPNEVFNIHNGNNGPERVYGIRDFYNELVYWTFPDQAVNPVFPTKILVWNYQNNTWAFFEDSFTCFGTFQKTREFTPSDLEWRTVGDKYDSWNIWNDPWSSPVAQSDFPSIISGNQQGYVFVIDNGTSKNEQSLFITNMITPPPPTPPPILPAPPQEMIIINHNLQTGDFVAISGETGITLFKDTDTDKEIVTFQVKRENVNTISIDNSTAVTGKTAFGWTGTYAGGGLLTRISQYNISSKQWNPGTPVGQQFRIPYIDFLLLNTGGKEDKTKSGEVSVDYFIDSTIGESIQKQTKPKDKDEKDVLLGSNTLLTGPEDNSTYQPKQVRIWHRYYLQSQGMMIQIKIFMTDDQMRDLSISQSNFQMDAMILYAEPSSRIIG